ncbi:hypothetical protein BCR44DRAFT_1040427 [Catenaria anguillulae PL171]|uniref:Uncharacterized protein n=1 Tax=Catenaria anguillulae PL171 TaxID=765915 RepID=A0A1Y2H5C3_9FUNG|nr:hypothetical protein BCR44DRAFT_1040427 [Catenaria anguillulae PL171]
MIVRISKHHPSKDESLHGEYQFNIFLIVNSQILSQAHIAASRVQQRQWPKEVLVCQNFESRLLLIFRTIRRHLRVEPAYSNEAEVLCDCQLVFSNFFLVLEPSCAKYHNSKYNEDRFRDWWTMPCFVRPGARWQMSGNRPRERLPDLRTVHGIVSAEARTLLAALDFTTVNQTLDMRQGNVKTSAHILLKKTNHATPPMTMSRKTGTGGASFRSSLPGCELGQIKSLLA